MAPTGRAARIISEKTNTDASTIHKVIYDLDLLDEIEVLKKGKVSYKFVFNLHSLEDQTDHIYITIRKVISPQYSMMPDPATRNFVIS